MDVVLKPSGSSGTTWTLKDRLGRHLGDIRSLNGFEIVPVEGSVMQGIGRHHGSLDASMTAIANHMAGACELDNED